MVDKHDPWRQPEVGVVGLFDIGARCEVIGEPLGQLSPAVQAVRAPVIGLA